MPDEETSRPPPGYRLDLVSDPCIIILRGPDGAVVTRFSRNVDKAGRRRRPRTSGGKTGRLRDHFLAALFYGLLACSNERRRDAGVQSAPVPVGISAALGVRGAAKE
jgi:hypothetical protein